MSGLHHGNSLLYLSLLSRPIYFSCFPLISCFSPLGTTCLDNTWLPTLVLRLF